MLHHLLKQIRSIKLALSIARQGRADKPLFWNFVGAELSFEKLAKAIAQITIL
jgi:hypothetical protein